MSLRVLKIHLIFCLSTCICVVAEARGPNFVSAYKPANFEDGKAVMKREEHHDGTNDEAGAEPYDLGALNREHATGTRTPMFQSLR